jgi:hypothetical protein
MDPKPLTAHLPPDSKAGTHDPLQRLVDKVRFAFTKSETPKIVHNSPIKQLFALDHGIKISRSTGPHAAQSQSCMLRDLGSALTSEGPTLATQPTGAMSPDSLRGWSAEASTSPAKQVRLATRWSPEKVNTPPRTPLQVRATPKIIDRPAAVARSSRQGATAVGGAVGLLRRILSPSKILVTDDEGAAPLYTRCSSMLAFEGGDAEPPSLTRSPTAATPKTELYRPGPGSGSPPRSIDPLPAPSPAAVGISPIASTPASSPSPSAAMALFVSPIGAPDCPDTPPTCNLLDTDPGLEVPAEGLFDTASSPGLSASPKSPVELDLSPLLEPRACSTAACLYTPKRPPPHSQGKSRQWGGMRASLPSLPGGRSVRRAALAYSSCVPGAQGCTTTDIDINV